MKADSHWEKIGFFPHHGICLPLSALRSKTSSGIGEFLDLIPLIDWCQQLKLDCIQLLPLNDTGQDPSPYNPISAYALDPIYLNLSPFGLSHLPFASLNAAQRLNRHSTLSLKLQLLRTAFQTHFPLLSKTSTYQTFLKQNPWLPSYALFKAHKETHGNTHWIDWPSPLPSPPKSQIDFHFFLQFHCFAQMQQVRAHATKQGVFLKGDLPILLSPDSADAWAHPHLFRTDLVAGAPPDLYNALGQHWGFPLFDWDQMRQTHFAWWKQRLQLLEQLFHIYRIDHVVGFFRIWGIPKGKLPLEGSFIPPDPHQWFIQGKELLEMFLASSSLLPIAEDLGAIPKEVYPILKDLGICGTKVVRWQRHWDTDQSYIPFDEYEPLSMTTLSTTDMAPLQLWWENSPHESAPFAAFMQWPYNPTLTQSQRLELLRAAHHTSSLFHINLLQEYLALFPELVSPHPEEERINTPGTVLPTNWTYRFRPFLEELLSHKELAKAITYILS